MSVELSIITSYSEFRALSSTWEHLRRQLNDNVFCNSWSWIDTWIKHFWQTNNQLYIHTWQYKGEVVGIVPCYLKSTCAGKELRFMATGEPLASEVCSEFQDFLIHSNYKDKILTQFTQSIEANKKISAIIFDQVLITSMAYQWFENVAITGKIKAVNNIGNRYLIPVVASQQQQTSLFKSKNIKRHAKKIAADAHWHVTMVNDAEALAKFYAKLVDEHNYAWQQRGKVGAFESATFTEFHRSFSQKALKSEELIAFEISYENEFAALFYGVVDGDTLYYYQSAVNHKSKLSSAGVAMHLVALDLAREKNLTYYDLMKGGSDSYKKQYLVSDISVVSCSVYTLKFRYITYFIDTIKNLLGRANKIINKLK